MGNSLRMDYNLMQAFAQHSALPPGNLEDLSMIRKTQLLYFIIIVIIICIKIFFIIMNFKHMNKANYADVMSKTLKSHNFLALTTLSQPEDWKILSALQSKSSQ